MAQAPKAMNSRNGNMTRVKPPVRANFPGTLSKPKAMTRARADEASIPATVIRPTTRRRELKILEANRFSASRPFSFWSMRTGTKAEDRAFSANRSRSRLGMRKAAL